MKWTSKQLVTMAMFIALSALMSFIKIPGPVGSIAMDSTPAFLGALLFGPVFGGIVGFFGHVASAATAGFQLGLPTHLVIAFMMFLTLYLVGLLKDKLHAFVVLAIGVAINGVGAPLALVPLQLLPMAVATGIIPLLTTVSFANAILGYSLYLALRTNPVVKRIYEA